MQLAFVGIVANLAVLVGLAFVLSRTVPRMPQNKLFRFAFLFVAWLPVNFVINYVNVQTRGFHKLSWAAALVMALILATFGTFLSSQSHKSRTP